MLLGSMKDLEKDIFYCVIRRVTFLIRHVSTSAPASKAGKAG